VAPVFGFSHGDIQRHGLAYRRGGAPEAPMEGMFGRSRPRHAHWWPADVVQLGGQRREMSVLFSVSGKFHDRRREVVAGRSGCPLNEYFSAMVQVLFRHGAPRQICRGHGDETVWCPGRPRHADRGGCGDGHKFGTLERLNTARTGHARMRSGLASTQAGGAGGASARLRSRVTQMLLMP
jgi:hypothetical protein